MISHLYLNLKYKYHNNYASPFRTSLRAFTSCLHFITMSTFSTSLSFLKIGSSYLINSIVPERRSGMFYEISLIGIGFGSYFTLSRLLAPKKTVQTESPLTKKIKEWEKEHNSIVIIVNHQPGEGGGILSFGGDETPSLGLKEAERIIKMIRKAMTEEEEKNSSSEKTSSSEKKDSAEIKVPSSPDPSASISIGGGEGLSIIEENPFVEKEDIEEKPLPGNSEIKSKKTVDLIINTPGGMLCAAEMIVHALVASGLQVNVYIPNTAFSAGTILALAGHKIYLDPISSFLGPVDPQISGFPAHYFDQMSKDPREKTWISDFFEFISTNSKISVGRVDNLLNRIRDARGLSEDEDKWIRDNLLNGKRDHDSCLSFSDLDEHISRVEEGIPKEIREIYDLHTSSQKKQSKGLLWSILG